MKNKQIQTKTGVNYTALYVLAIFSPILTYLLGYVLINEIEARNGAITVLLFFVSLIIIAKFADHGYIK